MILESWAKTQEGGEGNVGSQGPSASAVMHSCFLIIL